MVDSTGNDDPIQELKLSKALTQDKIDKLRKLEAAKSKKEAEVIRKAKRDPGHGWRN